MMSERVAIGSYKVNLKKLDLCSPGAFFFLKMPMAMALGKIFF